MTRYKGQLKATRTQTEFPHHVDIIVPPGGLGTRLDAMYDFHVQYGIKPQRGKASTVPTARSFDGVLLMRVWPQRLRVSLGRDASPAPCKPAPGLR